MTKTLGDHEVELLRWVAEQGPVSVGEVAAGYGAERSLARTTVQTMLERLRVKGRLARRRSGGRYRYRSTVPAPELLRGLVEAFVNGPLAGSVSPFVAYLAEAEEVGPEELEKLEEVVSRLQERRE